MDLRELEERLPESLEFLGRDVLGVSLWQWTLGLGSFLAVALVSWVVLAFLVRRFRKRAEVERRDGLRLVWRTLAGTRFLPFFFLALFVGAQFFFARGTTPWLIAYKAMVVAWFVQAALWGSTLAGSWVAQMERRRLEHSAGSVASLAVVGLALRIGAWVIALLLVLSNLGVDVTSLIAGLGVGGIAVALAVQNILGDVFASLSIGLDKPFVEGDFIITGNELGTVERIGVKTTRIRSLSGEQLVISNADLLASRIRNYKRMRERRVVFAFGILYETPPELVERIPRIVREAIEAQEQTRFDRAHFAKFGPTSLDFEVVYWMLVPDYNAMMDVQQRINLTMMRRFRELGVRFAYPTQILHLRRGEGPTSEPAPA